MNGEKFIEQAKCMVDCTDEYTGFEEYVSFYPRYSYMSNKQLRTYFTWRASERKKITKKITNSYLLVYVYEVLNNVGVSSNIDGIEKLIRILKEYCSNDITLGKSLAGWIKDYYICNNFDMSFKELVTKYKLEEYYPNISFEINKENVFDIASNISNYNIKNSSFYSEDNSDVVKECFGKVYEKLRLIFEKQGLNIDYLLVGGPTKSDWVPYEKAIYSKNQMFGSNERKEVIFANYETYVFENDSWQCVKYKLSNNESNILGYIMKCLEVNICKATNSKTQVYLTSSATNLISSFSEYYKKLRDVLITSEIDKCIADVVNEFFGEQAITENDTKNEV